MVTRKRPSGPKSKRTRIEKPTPTRDALITILKQLPPKPDRNSLLQFMGCTPGRAIVPESVVRLSIKLREEGYTWKQIETKLGYSAAMLNQRGRALRGKK